MFSKQQQYSRTWYLKNKEEIKKRSNKWNHEHREKKRETDRARYLKNNPDREKWIHRLSEINFLEKTALCQKCGKVKIIISGKRKICSKKGQEGEVKYYRKIILNLPEKIIRKGICPICLKEKLLCIDHCHNSKKFRGFICHLCNSILGFCNDDKNTLLRAIEYLNR